MPGPATTWMSQFYATLGDDRPATDELREASLASALGRWTSSLTTVVVHAFEALGMATAAKGHRCTVLPVKQHEYLGQDVMAFPSWSAGWQFPVAVCKLENSASDERVAYSLWKVLCVRPVQSVERQHRAQPQRREILRDCIPQDRGIDLVVPVPQPVTDTANLVPRNIRTQRFRLVAQTACRLADYQHRILHREQRPLVIPEILFIET